VHLVSVKYFLKIKSTFRAIDALGGNKLIKNKALFFRIGLRRTLGAKK
jgi:hypothetical protein